MMRTRVGNALVRTALAVIACLCVALWWAGAATARMPWWHVDVVSAPASQTGNEGVLLLEASNLGDAPMDGFANPVKIVGELPTGVTPVSVFEEGGGSFPIGINGVVEISKCAIEGQRVECTYGGPLLAYERLIVAIQVLVDPGAGEAMSVVSVSGGGASPISVDRQLALSDVPDGFGVRDYDLRPESEGGFVDTQAGSHPFQLTSTLTFNADAPLVFIPETKKIVPEIQPVALPKDVRFQLPPGLVGNPTALPTCRLSVFVKQSNTTRCPDSTAVGIATPIITKTAPIKHAPLAETVPIYNLEPAVGEPARFGFTTQAGPVVLDIAVRTGGDYGVIVDVSDIPDDVGFIASRVTFWGDPGDPRHDTSRGVCLDEYAGSVHEAKTWEFSCPFEGVNEPFLIMPTSCAGPWKTSLEGDPWDEIGALSLLAEYEFSDNNGFPVGEDGCDALSFRPVISVTPDDVRGSTPTGLAVGVHVDQEPGLNPFGLAASAVKDTTVTLPAGVDLNAAAADGLSACSPAQIALSSPHEQTCPESSKIGALEIKTPLLPNPLTGSAYLAQQEANPFGSLLAIYLVVYDPVSGVRVKLAGEVKPDQTTGQLVSTFKDTPQLPFEDLTLRFFGGSRAPLGTPDLCGEYTTSASIVPWSGNPASQTFSPPFSIASGPGGSACSNPLPFGPSLTAGSLNIQAGAFTSFSMTMSRDDGNQDLDAVQLKMPPGLLGSIASVKPCGDADANAGTCGPDSLIGETTVSVGLGGNPYSVKGGRVYITGPYEGAPYGVSIVNPAKAGPFDLENTKAKHPACDCLVVRARIEVDPRTAALTVTSDTTGPYAIPTMIEGIPLQIKHVNVTIDRPKFTFNPTNCSPMSIGGSITSSKGAVSALKVPFQVTNCATLKFKPVFKVSADGKTSRRNGASLHVKLSYPIAPFGSQANIGKVKVSLPKQLPSRLSTLQKACADNTFNQNPAACPPASRVGTATATTPVLPGRLQGPAYFVSHGGARFPELIVVLSGEGIVVDLAGETFINKRGITSSTFRTVPDVPVGTFELDLPEGPNSALAANGNLCKAKLRMPTSFVAADNASVHQTTNIAVTHCAKHKTNKTK